MLQTVFCLKYLGPCYQHFIFVVTKNGLIKLECLSLASLSNEPQHSSLLDPFVSYNENEVFCLKY